jgi:P-type Ca2+ transporter type 2C
VWAVNYFKSYELLDSLLKALTLAMSILPEEIPVAFTTFMALGAWRLMKIGIIVKQTKTVETLGSATVICTDKTGTITENRMSLAKVFVLSTKKISTPEPALPEENELIELAMWASEPIPFDPMEVALHEAYEKSAPIDKRPAFKMVHEYPLSGRPPMMTHIFENDSGERFITAKGAPEAIIEVSLLSQQDRESIEEASQLLSAEGFRVLGVGISDFRGNDFPDRQQQFKFIFKGLIAFYDPPKKNIRSVFEAFYAAGITVKIITGDNAATTSTIARQINFRGSDNVLGGEELLRLNEEELNKKVMEVNIFTRMFPEAKLRILNALKSNGQIVAMTGDGVNDGPALKAAHIGIAMGKKGSEIAREVSSLILTDDDLSKMVDAVAMGRKIYTNLKKAIQYIISIHIPIILTVFIPLVLGWVYPSIFSPVHIIFLELIMGPTCSIIYENEPMEKNVMQQKPRPFTTTFFNIKELNISILQGLIITAGTLFTYQFAAQQLFSESVTRTMVFMTLLSANIFLTLVNRSFYYSIFTTLRYKNNLVPLIIGITVILAASLLFVPAFIRFFEFDSLGGIQLTISALTGFVSVIWFEGIKRLRRTAGRS